MNVLNPLGFLGLAALLPVIALYFLKLKREPQVISSTFLWRKVLDDQQVNPAAQGLLRRRLQIENPSTYKRVIEELERRRRASLGGVGRE